MISPVTQLGWPSREIFMIFAVVGMLIQRVILNILNYYLFQDPTGVRIKISNHCNGLPVQHFLRKKICKHFYSNVKMQFNLIIANWVKSWIFFLFMKKVLDFHSFIHMA